MSKQLHKGYRKVLLVQNSVYNHNDTEVQVKTVLWCIPESITTRTVKAKHIGLTVYIGGAKNSGTDAWFFNKPVSLNLKNPLASKVFGKINIKYAVEEASSKALRSYILNTPSLSVGVKGTVQWFHGTSGTVLVQGQTYRVEACNINGAKTWFPETACMYLIKGEEITVDLKDMGTFLTCRITSGGHFDQAKWDSLDQSKLAFKCDSNGNAINGLFS